MTVLWATAFAVPLTIAMAFAVTGFATEEAAERRRERLVRIAPLSVVPAGLLAAVAPYESSLQVDWLLLGTFVGMDLLARPLVVLAVLLYGVALVFVPRSDVDRRPALSALLILCFVGNLTAFVAADAVTFYLGFTVMSFVGYALVIHTRTREARRAGQIYLVMTVGGECAVLAALMLTVASGGLMLDAASAAVADSDHRDLIIALLLAGFGIKAGTVPLHIWLPLAHPAAPTPASAVLSGVMIKAGLVGWLRFLPLGETESPGWGAAFVVVALLGALLAVPVGLLQGDSKVVLAYSSISQMGFLTVLVGVALAAPDLAGACVAAAVVYAVHHGLAKGALFLGIDVWKGYANRVFVTLGLVLAALAIAGAPLTSGHIAKYAAKGAVGSTAFGAVGGAELAFWLTLIGVGSTLLLARFAWLVTHTASGARRVDRRVAGWFALIVAGPAVTIWFVYRGPDVLDPPGLFDLSTWTDQLWPLALGLVSAMVAGWAAERDIPPTWLAHPAGDVVPPGDLVVPEERLMEYVAGRSRAAVAWLAERYRAMTEVLAALVRMPRWVVAIQCWLDGWRESGLVIAGLLAVALILAVGAG